VEREPKGTLRITKRFTLKKRGLSKTSGRYLGPKKGLWRGKLEGRGGESNESEGGGRNIWKRELLILRFMS